MCEQIASATVTVGNVSNGFEQRMCLEVTLWPLTLTLSH